MWMQKWIFIFKNEYICAKWVLFFSYTGIAGAQITFRIWKNLHIARVIHQRVFSHLFYNVKAMDSNAMLWLTIDVENQILPEVVA